MTITTMPFGSTKRVGFRRLEGGQRRIGDLGRLGDLRRGGRGDRPCRQRGDRGQKDEAVQAGHRWAPEGVAAGGAAVSIFPTVRLASTNVAVAALRTSALVSASRRST